MSQYNFVPNRQTYSPIEPAFLTCPDYEKNDYIIPVAWGPISKVIGKCKIFRGDSGQCVGSFYSRDVDGSDATPKKMVWNKNEQNIVTLK
jgi:hypothetical protein